MRKINRIKYKTQLLEKEKKAKKNQRKEKKGR